MSKPIQLSMPLRELIESENALRKLADAESSARFSYTVALVCQQATLHFKSHARARDGLLERYGKPVEKKPGTYRVETEQRAAFQKEYDDLLDTPITLPGVGRIRASVLEAENIKLTGTEFYLLRWLLKQDIAPVFEDETLEA